MNHLYPGHSRHLPLQTSVQNELNVLLDAAKTGAVVGASGAAAANLHRLRRQEVGWEDAMANTVKVGFAAGVATGAATAVGRLFMGSPALSLAATLATGTAVMYALNKERENASDEQ